MTKLKVSGAHATSQELGREWVKGKKGEEWKEGKQQKREKERMERKGEVERKGAAEWDWQIAGEPGEKNEAERYSCKKEWKAKSRKSPKEKYLVVFEEQTDPLGGNLPQGEGTPSWDHIHISQAFLEDPVERSSKSTEY